MKKYKIIEVNDNYKSAHYVECNSCEKISPFAIRIDNSSVVIFMSYIESVKECENNLE